MPSALVVKKGVNNCCRTSGAMPGPKSATENASQRSRPSPPPNPVVRLMRPTRISKTRSVMPGWSIDCIALRARLSSTCSTMVRSHKTGGKSASTCVCTRTDSLRACRLTSGNTASNRAWGATASRAWSRRRTKSCTLLITLPARSACSAMRSMASARSASSSLGGVRRSRSKLADPVA